MMRIAIESHVPFIRGVMERHGHDVVYMEPDEFSPLTLRDIDAIIIRTRTRCDADMLDGTRVRKIATATIGTDHIDLGYCRARGIKVYNAPGCNAPAVAQYVLAAIGRLYPGMRPTIGIVGVGHVGEIVRRWAEAAGFQTLLCDPPRAMREGDYGGHFIPMEEIAARADIITFHTPLDSTTFHLCGSRFIASLQRSPLIINAARGPVVDTEALVRGLHDGTVCQAVIDCWENEPEIDRELLALAAIATPHIAGYSMEGKRRASAMAAHAVDPSVSLRLDPVATAPSLDAIMSSYDPISDTAALKSAPGDFELLRNRYAYRSEPHQEAPSTSHTV